MAAGAVVDESLGVAVAERVVLGPEGQALCRWAHPQILTSWGRLYSLLRDALPAAHHRLGAHAVAAQQDEAGVTLQLAGGEALHADLLVAADGIRSTLRNSLLPAVKMASCGSGILRPARKLGVSNKRIGIRNGKLFGNFLEVDRCVTEGVFAVPDGHLQGLLAGVV